MSFLIWNNRGPFQEINNTEIVISKINYWHWYFYKYLNIAFLRKCCYIKNALHYNCIAVDIRFFKKSISPNNF